MKTLPTPIPDLVLLQPKVFADSRGYFYESFSQRQFDHAIGHHVEFVQDNQSRSGYGVVRGLHFQIPPFAQAKLVRCTLGKVLDVALDLRKYSPTFGQHFAVELSEDNHLQLFIPRGFAHGFSVLSPEAIFQYKCDNYYTPEAEGGISILDQSLGIDWKIPADMRILSPRDTRHPLISNFDSPF